MAKEGEKKAVKPKVDLMPKWALEQKCFDDAKIRDIKTGKEHSWPRSNIPTEQRAFEIFLNKIVDPDTGEYYPKRDEEGRPVNLKDNPKYVVTSILRIRVKDDSEYLVSKGYFVGYDALGDPVRRAVSKPEVWSKTHFEYAKDWDPKRKMIVRNCKGPGQTEEVYALELNEKNLKSLFDRRENDKISWIVKDEQSSTAKSVSKEPNINDTFKLFLKPFDYLYNAEYMTHEMKAQYRQEAIDAGLLAAPTTTTSATVTRTPPSIGTYS